MIRLKNSNLYQFSIYFLISLFLITFIPTVIIAFNYDYKADWTYTIENKSMADNTFFYEVDTHTTTLVNLLGFRFPNRTILIEINAHKNSDPFEYCIFQAISINKSQNSIISVSILEGYSTELPINYTLDDNNIYSIQFQPHENNNLTYIDVDVEYGYYKQGLNYLKLQNFLQIALPILIFALTSFVVLILILYRNEIVFLKDPFRIKKNVNDNEIAELLNKLIYSEIKNPEIIDTMINMIDDVKINDFHNASLKIFPIIENLANSIIASKGMNFRKLRGLHRKLTQIQKWGYLKKVKNKSKIIEYRNQLMHGDWKIIQQINKKYLFFRSLQLLVEVMENAKDISIKLKEK